MKRIDKIIGKIIRFFVRHVISLVWLASGVAHVIMFYETGWWGFIGGAAVSFFFACIWFWIEKHGGIPDI